MDLITEGGADRCGSVRNHDGDDGSGGVDIDDPGRLDSDVDRRSGRVTGRGDAGALVEHGREDQGVQGAPGVEGPAAGLEAVRCGTQGQSILGGSASGLPFGRAID